MGTSTEHVMTLANSIIGVSVLAMPFCFKQCGIVLSILMLLLSGIMTRLACHYLLKSAINARRRNFEILAFHTFGTTGKLAVELSIIGFMLGTCIAFFVVMGDLGPSILGPIFHVDTISALRPSVLMGLGLLVVLPLGLLRNVDSLSAICTASIAFYLCLVLKVMAEATTHLLSWDWIDKVNLWRPAGIPQCIPIFSMALSCQTQLFEIFDSVPNTPLEKMNAVVRSAVNICTGVYISVGFFGYIAYCTQSFSGNLLMSFSPTIMSDVMKVGFVLSVAVSFPLVIFPCRASLHSLLFRRGHTPHHELLNGPGNFIPEPRFKCLTICIIMVSLGTGLLIPNIEVVLGLVGSTIGIIICIIFPALTFIVLANKKNNERLLAQILIAVGLGIMVLGTYSNLYATEEAITKQAANIPGVPPSINKQPGLIPLPEDSADITKDKLDEKLAELPELKDLKTIPPDDAKKESVAETLPVADSNKRKEPPVPVAPGDNDVAKEDSLPLPSADTGVKEKKVEDSNIKVIENPIEYATESKREESVGKDAIKKEEEELKKESQQQKTDEFLEKLSKHEEAQKRLLEEQKAVLEEIKKQKKANEDVLKIKNAEEGAEKKPDAVENPVAQAIGDSGVNKIQKSQTANKERKIDIPPNNVSYENKKNVQVPPVENIYNNNLAIGSGKNNNMPAVKESDLKPVLTRNILKGIPLPLVKNNIILDRKPEEIKKTPDLKEDIQPQENKGMVRDILAEKEKPVKEEREKRDLEVVEKIDLAERSLTGNATDNLIRNGEKSVEGSNVGSAVSGKNVGEGDDAGTLKLEEKTPFVKEEERGESLSEMINGEVNINNKEKCSKESKDAKGSQQTVNKTSDKSVKIEPVNNVPGIKLKDSERQPVENTESIIKAQYLSNPELVLNLANLKTGDMIRNGLQDMKPMSRDLKSVHNPEDQDHIRREERASEVT